MQRARTRAWTRESVSAVWTTLRERERTRAKVPCAFLCCPFCLAISWVAKQHLPVTFCCCCYEAKQQSKRRAKKSFFFSFLFAILQWPHTINKTTCTNTNTHTRTQRETRIYICENTVRTAVHRLCTYVRQATWNGKITLSPIRRRLFCLPRFVCVLKFAFAALFFLLYFFCQLQ